MPPIFPGPPIQRTKKSSPTPLLPFRHQPRFIWIAMHIAQLLHPLALRPDVEIVESRLPKRAPAQDSTVKPGLHSVSAAHAVTPAARIVALPIASPCMDLPVAVH